MLMLCAAAVVAVLVSSCRAPASDAGRYQWTYVSHGDKASVLQIIDTAAGVVVEFDERSQTWVPVMSAPNLPDWNDIRKKQEAWDSIVKSYAQMPLEKQVAWARCISVGKFVGPRSVDIRTYGLGYCYDSGDECLKFEDTPNLNRNQGYPGLVRPGKSTTYKSTDDNLVVWFGGETEHGYLSFGLSHTPIDQKGIFLAPATIIDDVKAEIKRQAEKKK